MDREKFEQLLSDWLDEPQREDLREQVDAAVAGSDELRGVRAAWQRLDVLVRGGRDISQSVYWPRTRERFLAGISDDYSDVIEVDRLWQRLPSIETRVRWQALHARICAAAHPDAADVDGVLALLPTIDSRIDWSRFKTRVRDSIAASVVIDIARRKRRNWVLRTATAGFLATAAAVALFVWWPFGARPADAPVDRIGLASGQVEPSGSIAPQVSGGFARLELFREAADVPPAIVSAVDPEGDDADDVFLVINASTTAATAAVEVFGF